MTTFNGSLLTLAFVGTVLWSRSQQGHAFSTPTTFRPATTQSTLGRHHRPVLKNSGGPDHALLMASVADDGSSAGMVLRRQSMITPEGYGFAASAERILNEAVRETFYRAIGTERVINVMDKITQISDVALVFNETTSNETTNELIGLFTETDFIAFSTARSNASTVEESANFLIAPVQDYVTPREDLVSISKEQTANLAVALMKENRIRHLIVADKVDLATQKLLPESKVIGVINMQDVMSVVQKDERKSLTTLASKYPYVLDPVEQIKEEQRNDANMLALEPEKSKQDIVKFGAGLIFTVALVAFFSQSEWLHQNANVAMIGIFVLGYLGIIFEEVFEFNKAGVALLMSTGLWVTYADFFNSDGSATQNVLEQLSEQLAEVSDICFFLLAASAIVEVVDAHQGFKIVTNRIQTTSKKQLFWTIGFLTFFLSSILNNLTVTIVMVSLLRKLIPNDNDRRLFGAMVVVAANAGGVWTPIGDVTTTMLWINNQLSTIPTITELFIPSIVCLIASLLFLDGQVEEDGGALATTDKTPLSVRGQLVFWSAIVSLLSVPVFAELTGLPPYLAMLTGLGVVWTLTDIIHMDDEEEGLKVPAALARLDTSGILFFLGILMSIGVLDKSGLLKDLAVFLSNSLPSLDIIATVIGLASALIDNVPLVAATMGMYDLSEYATDDRLWQLIALCAGTGGSILVIGSASGVALMGLEKVDFLWYAKKVSIGAAAGYFAGIAAYLVQDAVLHGNNVLAGVLPQAAVALDVLQQNVGSLLS